MQAYYTNSIQKFITVHIILQYTHYTNCKHIIRLTCKLFFHWLRFGLKIVAQNGASRNVKVGRAKRGLHWRVPYHLRCRSKTRHYDWLVRRPRNLLRQARSLTRRWSAHEVCFLQSQLQKQLYYRDR